MDKSIQDNIIMFTVLQELRRASIHHESNDVKLFSQGLINKVNYELENWEKDDASC